MLLIALIILFSISCKKDKEEDVFAIPLQENLEHTKTSDPTKIEELFLIPTAKDHLLREQPPVLDKHTNRSTVLSDFEDKTGLYLDKELKKYLNRKKIYSKSSIFSDVP